MCGKVRLGTVAIRLGAGAVLWAMAQLGQGQTTSPQLPTKGEEQCVLLRNGNVLIGQVHREKDSYLLTRKGARVRLAGYQVEAVGGDLSALYVHQSRMLPFGEAVPHLKLAEWCLRHGLLNEARREVEKASRLSPDHPRLEIVQRRLAVAVDAAATPATAEPPIPVSGDAAAPSATSSAPPPSPVPDNLEEGDLRLRELPPGTMEQFRQRVQPLLLNSCTTSGCHRSGAREAFVLDRRALWRDAPQNLTVQNLAETLQYVDVATPTDSPLLQASGSLHAPGLSTPPLSAHSASYALLEEWLLHISGQEPRDDEASQEQPRESGNASPPPDDQEAKVIHTAAGDLDVSDAALDALLNEETEGDQIIRRSIQRGVRPAEKRRRDPFDPEEFNRRFSPRQQGR